ncbi:hypothetical protein BRADI_3g11408v3, partial [Brachypodium distachyon]
SPASARCVLAGAERCLALLRGAPPRPRAAPSAAELRPCRPMRCPSLPSPRPRRTLLRPPSGSVPADPGGRVMSQPPLSAVLADPGRRRALPRPPPMRCPLCRAPSLPGRGRLSPSSTISAAARCPSCRRACYPSPRAPQGAAPATERPAEATPPLSPLVAPCRHAPSAVNSFTEMQQAAVDTRDPALLPLILVGPLEEKDAVVTVRDDMKVGEGLRVCVGSMDACPPRFVVYASRESSVVLSTEEVAEMAHGSASTRQFMLF